MRRLDLLALLGTGGSAPLLTGCLEQISDEPMAVIDVLTFKNTMNDPAEITVRITDDGNTAFSDTIALSERYGERTNVVINLQWTSQGRTLSQRPIVSEPRRSTPSTISLRKNSTYSLSSTEGTYP